MKAIESSIVRIFATNNTKIVGVGFLISNRRVMTCAHVLATALGISRNQSKIPDEIISLDFPLIDDNKLYSAIVVLWLPPKQDGTEDIAILELREQRPPSSTVARIVNDNNNFWGKSFAAYGFSHSDGGWASGVVRGRIRGKRMQIVNKDSKSYFVKPGFSGSPVYCDEDPTRGVIGMISSGEANPDLEVGFMIPAETLIQWKDQQNVEVLPPHEISNERPLISTGGSSVGVEGVLTQMFSPSLQNRVVYIGKFEKMHRQSKPKRVFVALPLFDETRQYEDYRLIIEDGLGEMGFLPMFPRHDSDMPLEAICQDIIDTEAGVYDVTGYDANVLLKLGISIGLNQPAVVITHVDNMPLITALQQINPIYYENLYDLVEQIGKVVRERIDSFRTYGVNPRYCTSCGIDCIARKQSKLSEATYLLFGAEPQNDKALFHHIKKAAKNFNLAWQQPDGKFERYICQWIEEIRRCKLIFFHSKEGTSRHNGMSNAVTMLQLGLAVGLGTAWRMILRQNEQMPSDLDGYKYTTWQASPAAFDTALSAAVRQLLSEVRPFGGIYTPLMPSVVIEEDKDAQRSDDIKVGPRVVGQQLRKTTQFLNRVEELAQVNKAISEDEKLIAVIGKAGTGKTAFAIQVMNMLQGDKTLDGMIYLDTNFGISFQILFQCFLELCQPSVRRFLEHLWGGTKLSVGDKIRTLVKEVRSQKYVVFLDSIDDVASRTEELIDKDLAELINGFLSIETRTTFIYTSRETLRLPTSLTIAFDALPTEHAIQLLKQLDPDGNYGFRNADDSILRALTERVAGNAGMLTQLVSIIENNPALTLDELVRDFDRIVSTGSDSPQGVNAILETSPHGHLVALTQTLESSIIELLKQQGQPVNKDQGSIGDLWKQLEIIYPDATKFTNYVYNLIATRNRIEHRTSLEKNATEITRVIGQVELVIEWLDRQLLANAERNSYSKATSTGYIFISHSTNDRLFVISLANRLAEQGYASWIDIEDIPDGSTWMREIEKGVTNCGALIVVMSKDARESEWVERETLLGMNLRKPLFIVRIDDEPLPLHLINRQYTDYRTRPEAAFKKLVAALKKAPLTEPLPEPNPREQKKHSPEPNRLNFFKYVEQLPDGGESARIARALFAWAQSNVDSLTFSGRSEPAFHANLWVGSGGVTVFSVRAFPKQPTVEVPLQFLMSFPPYDTLEARLRLLRSLDQFMPQPFDDDRADRRPNIPLVALTEEIAWDAFINLITHIIDTLRAIE